MKISVFQATDGDCLLIRGDDDTTILVDGGRKGSFRKHTLPALDQLRLEGLNLDLVYVSHIDNDHISGLLVLMKALVDWRVFDFQHNELGNAEFQEPRVPRPPDIKNVWHNGFRELVGDNAEAIESMLVLAGQGLQQNEDQEHLSARVNNLASGVLEAIELNLRLGQNIKDATLNAPFGGRLMLLSDTPSAESPTEVDLGDFNIQILGPTPEVLEELRKEWNEFLDENQSRIDEKRAEIEDDADNLGLGGADPLQINLLALTNAFSNLGEGSITVPNVASLTLLVEADGQTILLTGDAGSDDLLKGLRQHGLITDDTGIHVNVLKVQHHGALANITEEFCKFVTADHYIFCGNGAHDNPELEGIKAFAAFRGDLSAESKNPNEVGGSFKFWFSSSQESANTPSRKTHMKKVEDLVNEIKAEYGVRFDFEFLRSASSFDILPE